jgi:hypothetical protein
MVCRQRIPGTRPSRQGNPSREHKTRGGYQAAVVRALWGMPFIAAVSLLFADTAAGNLGYALGQISAVLAIGFVLYRRFRR